MKRVPLDKYCEKKIATLQKNYIGLIDYIDISAVDNEEKKIISHQTIDSKDAPSRAKQLIKKNDILVSTVRPNLNAVAVIENETDNLMVASTGYCVLRCKDDADVLYMFNFCQSPYFIEDMTTQATGASYPAVSTSIVKSSLIPYYSIEEQHEIAKKIDAVSNLIALRKQQLSKLDELVKSRFIEMFGDINTNEKAWESQPLGELCTIVRGGSPRPIENYLDGDVPWIKIGDATKGDNVYLHSTKEHIIQDGVKKSRMVKAGSLIFANCGVSLGFARIITFDGCIHDGWLAMEDIDVRIDKVFLLQSLNQMTEHFRSIAPAGTQPNLNTAIMKAYVQIIPPMKLQKEYIGFVEQVEKSKLEIQKSLQQLETLKKALMQKYFG